jgi:hypothetical protein
MGNRKDTEKKKKEEVKNLVKKDPSIGFLAS